MPIYEYYCDACGHKMEILQSIGESAVQDCPQCNRQTLKKLISAAGFRLAGAGWYETDFKSDNKRNLEGDAQAQDKKAAEKTDTKKSESKKKDTVTTQNKSVE